MKMRQDSFDVFSIYLKTFCIFSKYIFKYCWRSWEQFCVTQTTLNSLLSPYTVKNILHFLHTSLDTSSKISKYAGGVSGTNRYAFNYSTFPPSLNFFKGPPTFKQKKPFERINNFSCVLTLPCVHHSVSYRSSVILNIIFVNFFIRTLPLFYFEQYTYKHIILLPKLHANMDVNTKCNI